MQSPWVPSQAGESDGEPDFPNSCPPPSSPRRKPHLVRDSSEESVGQAPSWWMLQWSGSRDCIREVAVGPIYQY